MSAGDGTTNGAAQTGAGDGVQPSHPIPQHPVSATAIASTANLQSAATMTAGAAVVPVIRENSPDSRGPACGAGRPSAAGSARSAAASTCRRART